MNTSTDPSLPLEETISIVGVGLIGGSIAAAVKRRAGVRTVIGVGRRPEKLEPARERGLVDEVTGDLTAAARRSSLMIFCTPVDRIVEGVRTAAEACRPGTVLTDAGSVKQAICEGLQGGLPEGVEFVGGHPLAGSEKQGFEFADPDLFCGRVCVVTPTEQTSPKAAERVARFWRGLGARVLEMTPADHDRALAETSHFPHLAAAALASTLSEQNRHLAATGFRDTTRIAAGDPDLWTAILLQNADAVLASLKRFTDGIRDFDEALRQRDATRLRALLDEARRQREAL